MQSISLVLPAYFHSPYFTQVPGYNILIPKLYRPGCSLYQYRNTVGGKDLETRI